MIIDDDFKILTQIGKALVEQFRENCQIIIYKIKDGNIDSLIIYNKEGNACLRQLNDAPSPNIIKIIKKDPSKLQDHVNHVTHTHDGRVLKTSTLYLKNKIGKLKVIFIINYDISNLIMAENVLHSFTDVKSKDSKDEPNIIPQNVNELLDDLIQESVNRVGKPVALMSKEDKVNSIQFLNSKGAFLITKSGDKVSQYFNISKYTLYSYIDAKK